jgi:hypothetical protein
MSTHRNWIHFHKPGKVIKEPKCAAQIGHVNVLSNIESHLHGQSLLSKWSEVLQCNRAPSSTRWHN